MRDSKLIALLRTLSTAQWRRFGAFVQSPYFNKNTDIPLFVDYLDKYYPSFTHAGLKKAELLIGLKSPGPRDEKSLSYLMNQTLALAENFLVTDYLREEPLPFQVLLLERLREAGLSKHFKGVLEKAWKNLQALPRRDGMFFHRQSELAFLEYNAVTDPNSHQFNELLQLVSFRLDAWYLSQKLPLLNEMATLERMNASGYQAFLADELERGLPANELLREPTLAVYFHAWRMTRHDSGEDFDKLLPLLDTNAECFQPSEQKYLYSMALNFCIQRINRFNERDFYQKYLEINEIMLRKGLLLEAGYLPPWHYMNLVNAGLKTGLWQWTWDFMHTWRDKLPPNFADNLFDFNLAQWHYVQKNHPQAQKLLVRVEFQDPMLALAARSLLIKILYETSQTELLFSSLEAARLFLHRANRMEPRLRRQMQQFIDFTRRLAKIDPPDGGKLKALAERVPEATEVMHRDWLVEMMGKGF